MIENATVKIYEPVKAKNAEGTIIRTFGYRLPSPLPPSEEIRADVQPKGLSESQALEWGVSNRASDAKRVFFSNASKLVPGNRVYNSHDYDTSGDGYYDIKGMNPWPIHKEAIVVPVQGES